MHVKYVNDYGNRVAIGIVLNPEVAEWEHNPAPDAVDQKHVEPSEGSEPWESCGGCRYLWNVEEFIFDTNELFVPGDGNHLLRISGSQMLKEIAANIENRPQLINPTV